MVKNAKWSLREVPVIRVRFQLYLNFLDTFWKSAQIPNFMKIRPVEAELFHADRRTDMTMIGGFQNFANAPKKRGLCGFEPDEYSSPLNT